jgi:hypothetical protein|tara:strand:- start:893 stop:1162 length:270 start_codon:yes stop_codon:yes gene_type:complete
MFFFANFISNNSRKVASFYWIVKLIIYIKLLKANKMRLREPFQGYKLSSGHFMFHMAYLIGSIIATKYVLPVTSKEEIAKMGAEEYTEF